MASFSDTTTARLEGYARARRLNLKILKDKCNAAGVYFVVRHQDVALVRWISLGWSLNDAKAAIDRMVQGQPGTVSESGYVAYA